MSPSHEIVEYAPRHRDELVPMWRAAFEAAVGVTDPHPMEEQVRYFETEVLPRNRTLVVLDAGKVVGFIAYSPETIAQLYVHLDHQRKGIGTELMERAKRESIGRLRLFTFQANEIARRFYERHGFRAGRRGFEPEWRLPDVEYIWKASDARGSP